MKTINDNFSSQSDLYAQYRPKYPQEMYDFIINLVKEKKRAWDCGTGNGQVAVRLAEYFDEVIGTDISKSQLELAVQQPNIRYIECRAESTSFPENHFDLITVAQAIHWFDFNAFYEEVKGVAKPGAVLAVIGYGLMRVNEDVDRILMQFYRGKTANSWDKERKYIDDAYSTIPFPFDEVQAPNWEMKIDWPANHFRGYIGSWSAVRKYIQATGEDPVEELMENLKPFWKDNEVLTVHIPLFSRIGYVGGLV